MAEVSLADLEEPDDALNLLFVPADPVQPIREVTVEDDRQQLAKAIGARCIEIVPTPIRGVVLVIDGDGPNPIKERVSDLFHPGPIYGDVLLACEVTLPDGGRDLASLRPEVNTVLTFLLGPTASDEAQA